MIELKFTYRFESAHRFIHSSSEKCMTPHGHTWRATLVFHSKKNELNDQQMLAEFGFIKKQWRKFIMETADHSFFHHHEDPIVPSMQKNIPHLRNLPFPGDPTTEMVAGLFLEKARSFTRDLFPQGQAPLFASSMIIQETPTNLLTLTLEENETFSKYFPEYSRFHGWWNESTIESRVFLKKEV